MVIFEFEDDLDHFYISTTNVVGKDKTHEFQIYEQLDAEMAFNLGA